MLLVLHLWHQVAILCVKQRSPQESLPAQHRVHLVSGAAALGWPHHKDGRCACPKQSSSANSTKEIMIVVLQESIAKTSWADNLYRWESPISHGNRRPQAEPVLSLRHRGMNLIKLQRKDAGGWKSEQHTNCPQPKPSSVQSVIRSVHQESDCTDTNEHAKTGYHIPQNLHLWGISHHHGQSNVWACQKL